MAKFRIRIPFDPFRWRIGRALDRMEMLTERLRAVLQSSGQPTLTIDHLQAVISEVSGDERDPTRFAQEAVLRFLYRDADNRRTPLGQVPRDDLERANSDLVAVMFGANVERDGVITGTELEQLDIDINQEAFLRAVLHLGALDGLERAQGRWPLRYFEQGLLATVEVLKGLSGNNSILSEEETANGKNELSSLGRTLVASAVGHVFAAAKEREAPRGRVTHADLEALVPALLEAVVAEEDGVRNGFSQAELQALPPGSYALFALGWAIDEGYGRGDYDDDELAALAGLIRGRVQPAPAPYRDRTQFPLPALDSGREGLRAYALTLNGVARVTRILELFPGSTPPAPKGDKVLVETTGDEQELGGRFESPGFYVLNVPEQGLPVVWGRFTVTELHRHMPRALAEARAEFELIFGENALYELVGLEDPRDYQQMAYHFGNMGKRMVREELPLPLNTAFDDVSKATKDAIAETTRTELQRVGFTRNEAFDLTLWKRVDIPPGLAAVQESHPSLEANAVGFQGALSAALRTLFEQYWEQEPSHRIDENAPLGIELMKLREAGRTILGEDGKVLPEARAAAQAGLRASMLATAPGQGLSLMALDREPEGEDSPRTYWVFELREVHRDHLTVVAVSRATGVVERFYSFS